MIFNLIPTGRSNCRQQERVVDADHDMLGTDAADSHRTYSILAAVHER
jgi:hypothetical protein